MKHKVFLSVLVLVAIAFGLIGAGPASSRALSDPMSAGEILGMYDSPETKPVLYILYQGGELVTCPIIERGNYSEANAHWYQGFMKSPDKVVTSYTPDVGLWTVRTASSSVAFDCTARVQTGNVVRIWVMYGDQEVESYDVECIVPLFLEDCGN